jgi:murein DD-endopeptidase MepM/ murein hydrolase activator NlpD
MARMNKFLGDMAASAVSYGMTGSASFNVLRYSEQFGNELYSTGLLELRVGDQGLSARLGAGGVDASLGAISSTLRGMVNWGVSGGSEIAARRDDVKNAATALRAQWGYGDGEAKELLLSILGGSIRLARGDGESAADAETITGQNGIRIALNRYQDEMSLGEQLLMGIVLQHEAYRDGAVSGDNLLETREAVSAHTKMALLMLLGGENPAFDDELARDMLAYLNAGGDAGRFNAYVDMTYDSSGDYWKLTKDGRLINDGQGYLKDENGMYINLDGSRSWTVTEQTIGAGGIETGLLNILFGGTSNTAYSEFTDGQVSIAQALMTQAGIKQTTPSGTKMRDIVWSKKNDQQALNMNTVMFLTGGTVAAQVFARYYDERSTAMIAQAMNMGIGETENRSITYNAFSRYGNLLGAKAQFFSDSGDILDSLISYYVSGSFIGDVDENKENGWYPSYNYQHYGIDLSRKGGPLGDAVFAGLSGLVTAINQSEARNGKNLQMEYGYNFEGGFIGTGIYGEYLHLQNDPAFMAGQYISSTAQIGSIGATGIGTGAHLHYDIFTQNGNFSESTLKLLYGANAAATSISSLNGYKTVYDPALYYSNWLQKELLLKDEWFQKYGKR